MTYSSIFVIINLHFMGNSCHKKLPRTEDHFYIVLAACLPERTDGV